MLARFLERENVTRAWGRPPGGTCHHLPRRWPVPASAPSVSGFLARLALAALLLAGAGTIAAPASANTAPWAYDGEVQTDEDVAYTFAAANFNFVDADTNDALESVKILSLPGSGTGTLKLDGAAIASGDLPETVSASDLGTSKGLVYEPPANANGNDYTTFTFKVNDGDADSVSIFTMTIDVDSVPDVRQVAVTSTPRSGTTPKKYGAGEKIHVTVTFDEQVMVTGDPLVRVVVGANTREAVYASGSGSRALVFAYTVQSGDSDSNGIAVNADVQLDTDLGSEDYIRDSHSHDADVTFTALAAQSGHPVDGNLTPPNRAPTASNGAVQTDEDAAYTFGPSDFNFMDADTADALESVKIVTVPGKGKLVLDGIAIASADLPEVITASDLDAEKLTYEPPAGANGNDYTTFTFKVNDGDADSASSYTMTIDVDSVPDVTGVAVTSTPRSGTTPKKYGVGETIQIRVRFDEAVTVTGDPHVEVVVGANTREAAYTTGSRKTTLVFEYTVLAGDSDSDGIAVKADVKLDTDPGAEDAIRGGDGHDADVTFTALAAQSSHQVDGSLTPSNRAPTASNGEVETDEDAAYTFAVVDFNFMDADTADGLESVKIVTVPGNGELVFDGTAIESDDLPEVIDPSDLGTDKGLTYEPPADANGDDYTTFTFKVNDGEDDSTSSYTMTIDVDPVPDVTGVAVTSTPTSGTTPKKYGVGETIQITVTFDEAVTVTDDPLVQVEVGANTRDAVYASGSGSTALVFAYTVLAGDSDSDGIAVKADVKLDADDYIRDSHSHNADVTFTALATQSGHPVDGNLTPPPNRAPTASDGEVETDEDAAYTFGPSDFNFMDADTNDALESVKIVSLPGSGTGTLQLDGTAITSGDLPQVITVSDLDAEKLTYEPPADANGNDYTTFTFKVNDGDADSAAAYTMTIDVDAVPDVTRVAVASTPTSGTTPKKYGVGETIVFTVTFDEAVTVTGDPVLQVVVGTNTKEAAYATGSRKTALVFEYTVQSGDRDNNGISIGANALDLDTDPGTEDYIRDSDGQDADLTFTALAAQSTHQVDGSLTPPSNRAPTASDGEVETDEDVAYTFAAADFNFMDADTADALESVKIVTLPGTGKGTLKYDGVAIESDDLPEVIDASDLGTDKGLTYEPPADANGNDYTTFTFKVNDGDADSASSYTMTIDVDSVPDVTQVAVTSTPTSGTTTPKKYGLGEKIVFTVTFDEAVRVTSDPVFDFQLANPRHTGANTSERNATYVSGSDTTALVFAYTVQSGDEDNNGILIGANALDLDTDPGAEDSIHDSDGNNADLSHADVGTLRAHQVDSSLTPPSLNTEPTAVDGEVETDEDVAYTFAASAFNFIDADTNDALESVKILSLPGSGTGTLKLDGTAITSGDLPKTVTKTELDNSQLTYEPPADENGNDYTTFTFKVNDGNADSVSIFTMTIDVDPVPDVTQVAVTSTPTSGPTPKKYGLGEKIVFTVTFDEAVTVTSDPVLQVVVGTNTKEAAYATGSGSTALVFAYTVASGDVDSDGIAVNADVQLDTDPGAEDAIRDRDRHDADVTFTALAAQSAHQVDHSLTPPAPPVRTSDGDVAPPSLREAQVTNSTLTLTYDEALDTGSVPVTGDFRVSVATATIAVRAVVVNGPTVTLTLARAVAPGERVTLTYTPGTAPLRDVAGNAAAGLSGHAVTHRAPPVEVLLRAAVSRVLEGLQLSVTVSLSADPQRDVTVPVVATPGTAGPDDYALSATSVTFARGETAKTVIVSALTDDLEDEPDETVRLAVGADLPARVTAGVRAKTEVTIENRTRLAAAVQAWTARFGRTVGTHVTDAVGARLRGAPGHASHLTIGGYRLPLGRPGRVPSPQPSPPSRGEGAIGGSEPAPKSLSPGGRGPGEGAEAEQALAAKLWGPLATDAAAEPPGRLTTVLTEAARVLGMGPGAGEPAPDSPWLNGPGPDPRLGQSRTLDFGRTVTLRHVLLGSAFRLNLGAADAGAGVPRLTAWGRFAGTTFNGQDGALALNGDVFTGTVGVDREWDRLLAGVAVAHSRGDGAFTDATPGLADRGQGGLEQTLTSLHPYLRYAVTDRLDVWGLVGYGWGELDLEMANGTTLETDTTLLMGAFGGRGLVLVPADAGGFQLATRTDAMLTQTSTDAAANSAATDADAHRVRVLLEGSRAVAWDGGQSLTPTVELGLRHDWGDAETGFGLEVGGRVQYTDPGLGLTIEGAVRGLLAHEDADYQEWGASGNIRLAPGAGGQGLSLTVSPTWGAASSGVEGLWSRQTTQGLAPQGRTQAPGGRLQAEVGYGLALVDMGLVTPYAGTVLAEGADRSYRLGMRWAGVTGLQVNLEGTRQEAAAGQQPVNQGVQVQATWGF